VLLLALGQADLALHAPALEVQVQRHQGIAGTLDLADQLVQFGAVQQQLAGAQGLGMAEGGRRGQRADVGAEQEQFAVAHDDIGLLDLYLAFADGLDFPPLQYDAGFIPVLDEVVEKSFFIVNNTHEIAKIRVSVKLLLWRQCKDCMAQNATRPTS